MLVGSDWTVGFNLKEPDEDTDSNETIRAFSAEFEIFTSHLQGESAFVRDMTVLAMIESDW